MTQTINVAICGLGERISHVARAFQRNDPRFVFSGFYDPADEPNGSAILAAAGIHLTERYGALEDLLAHGKPDLLLVGSPNSHHLEHIRAGLESGVRIFSEKPLVTTEADTYALLELLRAHGRDSVMVGLVLRYSPLYREFKRLQDAGVLGQVVSLEGSENLGLAHGAFLMRDWRRHEVASGGYLLEKCCHDFDLYQGIMGARPRRLSSFGGRKVFVPANEELEALPIYDAWRGPWDRTRSAFSGDADIVDHQTAIVEYENGAALAFSSNIHAANKTRRICAIGTNGMIEGDFERNYIVAYDAPSGDELFRASYEFDPEDGHYGAEDMMVADIAAHIFDARPLPVSAVDALEAGLTAIKLDEARKTSSVIEMDACWTRFDAALAPAGTEH